jgi:hypothetical protein
MRLSFDYPMADPLKNLKFYHSWQNKIHPIFAARLAAFAKAQGKVLLVSSGYRSTEEQAESYKSTGGKLVNGQWVGGNGMAAVPGRSWHEFSCATDWADIWARAMDKNYATDKQLKLIPYGIFKPLTKGNKTSVFEDWHVQPIETKNVPLADRKTFFECKSLPKLELGAEGDFVKLAQVYLGFKGFPLTLDGDYGNKTRIAVMGFQKGNGLDPDGVLGPVTWLKLLYGR